MQLMAKRDAISKEVEKVRVQKNMKDERQEIQDAFSSLNQHVENLDKRI